MYATKPQPWRLTVSSAPGSEPLSTAEAKTQLRVDTSDEDTYIDALVKAARERVELEARRALITQTLVLTLDEWPRSRIWHLPRAPIQSVSSIVYTDEDGNNTTWNSSNYIVDTTNATVHVKKGISYPSTILQQTNAINVTYVAGYGASGSDVPERYRLAIRLLVGHWFENREQVVIGAGLTPAQLPEAVKSLVQIDRGSWF